MVDQPTISALSAFIASERRSLISSPAYANSPFTRAMGRRAASANKTKILNQYFSSKPRRRTIRNPELLLYKKKEDEFRSGICPLFDRKFRPIAARLTDRTSAHYEVKDFSFVRNPVGTLAQLSEIVELSAIYIDVKLDFLDEVCDDVAPYIILAELLKRVPRVFGGGLITKQVLAVLRAVGLARALGINRVHGKKGGINELVLPFKLVERAPPGVFGDQDHQLRPQYKERVSDDFCDHLSAWLSLHDLELKPEAHGSISNSITEALDNAERHGRPDVDDGMGDWAIAGFSRLWMDDNNDVRISCSFSIVSRGATIAESLATASQAVSNRIDQYVNTHKGRRRDEALLRTIMAVQDGVTRVAEASQDKRGGVGLLSLAAFIADLGETTSADLQSVFTILSGSSCLRITGPFRKGVVSDDSSLRTLWFNEKNCSTEPPSSAHAFTVGTRFDGAILSANFTFDPGHLLRKESDEPRDGQD